ncbi:MAG: acyl carrier protein [Clostridiaceae bacterium]|jgi:acyl carrier protein|nr:acyl carrier protein [Clostridiaceae bacterium]
MGNKVELRIREIISKNVELTLPVEKIGNTDDLTAFGIKSISTIKVIVAIELEFGIEFEDEDLNFGNFRTISSFISYVEEKIGKISP